MRKYVKCIDADKCGSVPLKLYKIYQVFYEFEEYYRIICEQDELADYMKYHFIEVDKLEEVNMITKDNIAEVLKHNNLKFKLYRNCIQLNNDDSDNTTVIDLDHVNLISIIEAHYGMKLELLLEPNLLVGKWIKCISDNKWCRRNKWYMVHDKGIVDNRIVVCDHNSYFILPKDYFDLRDIRDYNPDVRCWFY